MFADRPKLLGDTAALAARLKQLREPHFLPLTTFVEELRGQAGPGLPVPYFDPWDGGIDAEVLFLLEAPGRKAVQSGFVSRDNQDETAKNFFELCLAVGLDRKRAIVWNAVPWYIGTGTRIRAATPGDLEAGLRPLPRLLEQLPKLRVIVLVGRKVSLNDDLEVLAGHDHGAVALEVESIDQWSSTQFRSDQHMSYTPQFEGKNSPSRPNDAHFWSDSFNATNA